MIRGRKNTFSVICTTPIAMSTFSAMAFTLIDRTPNFFYIKQDASSSGQRQQQIVSPRNVGSGPPGGSTRYSTRLYNVKLDSTLSNNCLHIVNAIHLFQSVQFSFILSIPYLTPVSVQISFYVVNIMLETKLNPN